MYVAMMPRIIVAGLICFYVASAVSDETMLQYLQDIDKLDYIGFRIELLEEAFDTLEEKVQSDEYKAKQAAKQERSAAKRAKWKANLEELELEVASLGNFNFGEDRTDSFLENLSGEVMASVNDNVRGIQADITKMKKLLTSSLGGVDKRLTSVKESAVSRNVEVAGAVLYGGVGSACTFATDCVLSNSDCRHGSCQCLPGLSFDSLRNKCAKDCTEYGKTYQFTKNRIISEFNNAELDDVTLAECKKVCENGNGGQFVCRSLDYFPRWKECYLSEHTRNDVPESSWIYNGAGFHMQRDCSYTN